MSNLATVTLQSNTEYTNLATLASITFTQGEVYTLQIDGDVMICEKATKPTAGGFRINYNYPFQFEAGTDALWVKNVGKNADSIINIAD